MRRALIISILSALALWALLPACKQSYSVGPLGPAYTATMNGTATYTRTRTVTPTATITNTPNLTPSVTRTPTSTPTITSTPTVTVTSTPQIAWYNASLARIQETTEYGEEALLYLRVNSAPDTISAVTLIGSDGTTVAMPCDGTMNMGDGQDYGEYFAVAYSPTFYTAGVTYTFYSATSAGAAWGSIVAPGGITQAVDGSESSWIVPGMEYEVWVTDSGEVVTFDDYCDTSCGTTVTVPSSAYIYCGVNQLATACDNFATGVTNAILVDSLGVEDYNQTPVTVTAPCTPVP